MLHVYERSLRWVLRHRPVMLAVFVAVLGATGYLYVHGAKGFIPDTDNDQFMSTRKPPRAPRSTRWSTYQKMVAEIVVQGPGRRELLCPARAAAWRFGGSNTGRMMVNLKPRRAARGHRRPRSSTGCGPKLSRLPGLRVFVIDPAGDPRRRPHVQEQPTISRCRARTRSSSIREAPKLERVIARLPGLAGRHQRSADQERRASTSMLDRDRAAALQSELEQIASARCTTPSARSWPPPSTRPRISTACCWRCCRKYQQYTDDAGHDLPEIDTTATWCR